MSHVPCRNTQLFSCLRLTHASLSWMTEREREGGTRASLAKGNVCGVWGLAHTDVEALMDVSGTDAHFEQICAAVWPCPNVSALFCAAFVFVCLYSALSGSFKYCVLCWWKAFPVLYTIYVSEAVRYKTSQHELRSF